MHPPPELPTCSCCGGILPASTPPRWDDIIAVEHARRALEVALVSGTPIAFVGIGQGNQAVLLARWARAQGLAAYATAPCPCGNYGSVESSCTCSVADVRTWQRRPAFAAANRVPIVVQVEPPAFERRSAHRAGRRSEPEEVVLARVAAARARAPERRTDGAGERLLQAAQRQLCLTPAQLENILDVARAIAALADTPAIGPAHLAEALQYRSRYATPPELLEPGS